MKRISARNLKNTLKLGKTAMWRSKTTICEKNVSEQNGFSLKFSRSSRDRAGPIRALMGPYGLEEIPKIRKKFALIGAFKEPVTLP